MPGVIITMSGVLLLLSLLVSKTTESDENFENSEFIHSTRRYRRDDLAVLDSIHTRYSNEQSLGTSAYFSGSEIIQFRKTKIFNAKFTVELWMKPEGGQIPDVPILNYYDQCLGDKEAELWRLGLKEISKGRDQRVYFSLKTHRINVPHVIIAHTNYKAGEWVHVAAVFNGTTLKLYINQAQVAVSHKQLSPVSVTPYSKCEVLELGGDSRQSRYFRGMVDDLRVWNIAKSHRSIVKDISDNITPTRNGLALSENFETVYSNGQIGLSYVPITLSTPQLISSTRPKDVNRIEVRKPLCGVTVCDNPEIIRGYKANIYIKGKKILRYRLINIADDDGGNPLVTRAQIEIQHSKLNEAFSRYNITWKKTDFLVKNTSLRAKTILFTCNVGMGRNSACLGSCTNANPGKTGNENFKSSSNTINGDDFLRESDLKASDLEKPCYDPRLPNKPGKDYLTVLEFKRLINLDNRMYLNVFIAKWDYGIYGKATFPWDKFALGVQGGTLLSSKRFGKTDGVNDMVHELGHNLGLWHVHRGVTGLDCDDPCFETHASMELGDLCADTNPTPVNCKCSDSVKGKCGNKVYKNTPFRNYMGYGTGSCPNHFTEDQVARMHCYTDMMYQSWSVNSGPSAITIGPKIVSYYDNVLLMEWLPPIGMGTEFTNRRCNSCYFNSMKLSQYAFTAVSPVKFSHSRVWAPDQATGPPDAKKCRPYGNIWVPDQVNVCSPENCFIDLGFKHAVIPTEIKIWVTYNLANGLSNVELLHVDGGITSLGRANVQCDTPYTKRIVINKLVDKVRLRVSSSDIGIDAVQLVSDDNHQHCMNCPRVEYMVERLPPFQSGTTKVAFGTRFEDTESTNDVTYEYRIKTKVGDLVSPPSLPVKFSAKTGFCGDGVIQTENNEDCDDGNSRDGDGCSIQCRKEDVFKCKGQPSICYKYEGDGICESFEKQISTVDCGFYVPDGFEDQWAVSAQTNPKYLCQSNPISMIQGPPPRDLKCIHSASKEKKSWRPCDHYSYAGNYWIEAGFENEVVASAVIVYIASDGKGEISIKKQQYKNVELIDVNGEKHGVGHNNIHIDCKRHPLTIPVFHDMTKPYFKTKKVRISFSVFGIAISAVALRSSTKVNPAVVSDCDVNAMEYYNPKTHSCYSYKCSRPVCQPLMVKHADRVCTGINDGDYCKVKCRQGYLPTKPVTIKCILGKWKGPIKPCVPVDCGKLKVKRATVECKEGTTYNRICSFHCISPARLSGTNSQVVCMKDGLWSTRKASCELQCPTPIQIENAAPLSESCDANHMKAHRKNEMGTVCRFECLPGFAVVSRSSMAVGKHVKLTCMDDGKWTHDALCKPIRCPQLSLFEKQVYNCSKDNAYDSVCLTVCPRDKVLHEVRCQKDGTWSSSFDYCKYRGKCDIIDTKEISLALCRSAVKSMCEPKCKIKDHDVVIRGKEELTNINVVCLPNLKWYPDPSSLYCMPSCVTKYLGDGYCDCRNNHKHCKYDDGDCCATTVKGGRGVRFMDTRFCKCADPRAQEMVKKEPKEKEVEIKDGAGSGYDAMLLINRDDEGEDDEIGVIHSLD